MDKFSRFVLLVQLTRPHTLPLAVSGIICANALSYALGGYFSFVIGFLLLSTAVFLQILSNLANDYGDMIKGADLYRDKNAPKRLIQQGKISRATLKIMFVLTLLLSLISGSCLLFASLFTIKQWLLFLGLGTLSLVAAITYTIGRYAYGYMALGEVAVFLFFGILAVVGGFYLQTKTCNVLILFPACGLGLLCATVLHINNIRDIYGDKKAGKITLANLLGLKKAKMLHMGFLFAAILSYGLFICLTQLWGGLLICFTLPQLFKHLKALSKAQNPQKIGQELKNVVLLTWWMNCYFSLGMVIF